MDSIFDLSNVQFSFETYFGCQIAYYLILLLFWNKYVKRFESNSRFPYLFLCIMVIFSIYGFENGDFYGYQRYLQNKVEMASMEPIYTEIAEIVSYNYFLFRLIVWGCATLLVYKASQNFGVKGDNCLFCLFVMFISNFDYARVSLAMAIYFYGISFLCTFNSRNKIYLIIGFAFVAASYFFHHSMIVCILLTPVLFLRLNKKRIILILIFLFLSGTLLNSLFMTAFGGGVFGNAELNEKLTSYEGIENGFASSYEWMRRAWEYTIFSIPALLFVQTAYSSKSYAQIDEPLRKLFVISFAITMFAISTLIGNAGSFVFFSRYLNMAIIPLAIITCYLRTNGIMKPKHFTAFIVYCMLYRAFSVTKLIMGGNMF